MLLVAVVLRKNGVLDINGTSRFLVAAIAYNEVNSKLSILLINSNYWNFCNEIHRILGFNGVTTALPSGVIRL